MLTSPTAKATKQDRGAWQAVQWSMPRFHAERSADFNPPSRNLLAFWTPYGNSQVSSEGEVTKYLIALAVALSATAAHADSYTYMCKVGGRLSPVTANRTKGTLTWRGTTFRGLKDDPECANAGFTATKNGQIAELCVATQGVASLTIGKDEFDCQQPGRRGYKEWASGR